MRIAIALMLVGALGCGGPVPDPEEAPDAGKEPSAFVCSTATCRGCCDGNRCRTGNLESACGTGGAACVKCGADALCGTANRCEPLDPNRYGLKDAGVTMGSTQVPESQRNVQTCGFYGNSWICW